mmetsp:Transcript_21213/g.24622  ORF Transcript_21213/g.24622 Transcript_21213/m.24622 type:complete len:106 (-) Transcript_21213:416-733(-)
MSAGREGEFAGFVKDETFNAENIWRCDGCDALVPDWPVRLAHIKDFHSSRRKDIYVLQICTCFDDAIKCVVLTYHDTKRCNLVNGKCAKMRDCAQKGMQMRNSIS